ncbi:hypothetical protein ACLOJK_011637 [Asimina triloba]
MGTSERSKGKTDAGSQNYVIRANDVSSNSLNKDWWSYSWYDSRHISLWWADGVPVFWWEAYPKIPNLSKGKLRSDSLGGSSIVHLNHAFYSVHKLNRPLPCKRKQNLGTRLQRNGPPSDLQSRAFADSGLLFNKAYQRTQSKWLMTCDVFNKASQEPDGSSHHMDDSASQSMGRLSDTH